MHLLRFTCENFRCLKQVDLTPEPGINVIRGNNAQGKTSVLEAVLFATTSKSHRTNLESDLVCHGTDGFRLQTWVRRCDRDVSVEAAWWRGTKRFKVNGVAQMRISDVLGKIHVVLFSPEDATLVKGTAAHRRRYLDMALSQLDFHYLVALQRYRQALRQRNELLRAPKPDLGLLDVWDVQLSEHAVEIMAGRRAFIQQLARHAAASYSRIAREEPLDIAYEPDVPLDDRLAKVLARTRDTDVKRRVTSRGPHRDDFVFTVGGQPARNFASQGQQKTAAMAIKLAELELAKDRSGEYPILLLDEVLSELDETRAHHLLDTVENGIQCLLTTTNRAPHDALIGTRWPSYSIERGRLEKT